MSRIKPSIYLLAISVALFQTTILTYSYPIRAELPFRIEASLTRGDGMYGPLRCTKDELADLRFCELSFYYQWTPGADTSYLTIRR